MSEKICIYCRGAYGVQTYFKLKQYGIKVSFFGDREKEKQGYVIDGIYCKSYEDVMNEDRDIFLIVAITNPADLIEHFKAAGFTKVFDIQSAFKELTKESIQKIEPICNFEKLEEVKSEIYKGLYLGEENFKNIEVKNMILEYRIRKKLEITEE